jgi:hypothetical protein
MFALSGSASAAIDTTTTGRVCCTSTDGQLENFGDYTFSGKTTPSLAGQFVYFQYKRPAATRWRNFKVIEPEVSTGKGFFVANKSAPRDAISDRHRWRARFTMSVTPGAWKIRALFRAQDGYRRSFVSKRYQVS